MIPHPFLRLTRDLILGIASMTLASSATAQTNPAPAEIYLLVGQSNMAGRGKVQSGDKIPDPQVLILDKSDAWASQGEPIHFDKGEAGVGLGFAFAKLRAADKPGVIIGLVPSAFGGTSMDQWQPEGELYKNAIRRTRLALEKGGALKAILWHQGESECGSPEKASAYAERLGKLIQSFRTDLNLPNVPFIAGELGEFLYTRSKSPLAQVVNGQIQMLPQKIAFTAAVSSKDLKDKGDQLHFDSASLKEFGKRYYEAFSKLENGKSTNINPL